MITKRKVKQISTRIMATLFAFFVAFGTVMPSLTQEVEAAESVKCIAKMEGRGYEFKVTSGSAKGAIGTCCDPFGAIRPETGTGTVYKLSNTSKMARTAYFLYKNKWNVTGSASRAGLGNEGFSAALFCQMARADDKYKTDKTRKEVLQFARATGMNNTEAREKYYLNTILKKVGKNDVPDNFEAYFLLRSGVKQDALVWKSLPTGSLTIVKKSKDTSVLGLVGYKTFKGCVYKLYRENGSKDVYCGDFNVKADGTANTIKGLVAGSYYVKETATNNYYKLDKSNIKVTVKANKTVTLTVKDDIEEGTAEIIKREVNGQDLESGDQFTFKLVNKTNSKITKTVTLTVNEDGESVSGSVKVPAGTYTVTETAYNKDKYIDATGTGTVTVPVNGKGTITWMNERVNDGELYVRKRTLDDGPLDGFKFRVTGKLYNEGTITAPQIITAAEPTTNLSTEDYTVDEWTVDADDLSALNASAKNRENGAHSVKLTSKAISKAMSYVQTADATVVQDKEYFEKNGDSYDQVGMIAGNENPSEEGWYEQQPEETIDLSATVAVNLKDVEYDSTHDAYVASIANKTETSVNRDRYVITFNNFDWKGAATDYKDVVTGEAFTILTTADDGNGYNGDVRGIRRGITKGSYTVTEVMTDAQSERYKQPASQTLELQDEEGSLSFTFENEPNWKEVKLKKTSIDGIIEGVTFRLTGTTAFGDTVDLTDETDENGYLDFGFLHKGDYVIEETSFNPDFYINNHVLAGYDNPAMEFKVKGDEEGEIEIEFDNMPKSELRLAKVDGDTFEFLENAEFELYEDDEHVYTFQIVRNDDGTAGINTKYRAKNCKIEGVMDKTIWDTEVDGETGEEKDRVPDDTTPTDDDDDAPVDQPDDDTPSDTPSDDTPSDTPDDEDALNWATLRNLTPNKTYTLKEIKAPQGYTAAKDITFVFDESPKSIIIENFQPHIETLAWDTETGTRTAKADSSVTIKDKVTYENLKANTEYTMKGAVYQVNTLEGRYFTVGNALATGDKTFTTDSTGKGEITVDLGTFDASALKGKRVVVYEDCYEGTESIASHRDPDSETQSIDFPDVGTQADRAYTDATHKVVDTVKVNGLTEGKEYKVDGVLMDKATKQPMKDKDGKTITASKTFTATASTMEVEVTFDITNLDILGKTGVVYEKLFYGDIELASHEDPDDPKQTVEFPNPKYNMYKVRNEDAPEKASSGKYGFFFGDKVTYTVFIENQGNVDLTMDVTDSFVEPEKFSLPVVESVKNATQNSLSADKNKVNITLKAGETAEVVYSAIVQYEIPEYLADDTEDSDSLKNGEDCNRVDKDNTPDDNDGYVNFAKTTNVKYKDPKDPENPKDFPNGDKKDDAQTPVQKPQIGTNAIDKETADHISMKGDKITVIDEVSYAGLTIGKEYTVQGELKNKKTKKTVAEGEATFTPTASRGMVEVEFTFSSKGNETFVAFEELYDAEGESVAEHKDINDEDQTIYVPEIGTTANLGGKTVKDKVEYKNLLTDRTYVVRGFLVNAKGEKLKGSDGAKKFTAEESNGSVVVELPIKYDLSKLSGMKLVAYEEVYIVDDEGTETIVATHKDLNDKSQTVRIGTPDTGDKNKAGFYGLLIVLSAAGLIALRKLKACR